MSNTKHEKSDDKVKSINEPATQTVDPTTPHSINEPPGSTVGNAPPPQKQHQQPADEEERHDDKKKHR